MLVLENLRKEFKKPIRKSGVLGMFQTLFSREYNTKVAVDNVSLTINKGEIVGYIGANGAGKSTSIKMMCGILTPTSGKVLIDGVEPYKKRRAIASKIGVVTGQKTQLWWDIQLIETFKILKEIYLIPDEEYNDRFSFLCELLGLNEFLHQTVRSLSLGQRMRADLAASFIHNPAYLFLDEPTIGLDVLVKEKVRKAIKEMNHKYHTTVILTTHDMKDIEDLCSRVVLIEKGTIIFDGPLSDIALKFGDFRTISITTTDEYNVSTLNTFDGLVDYSNKDSTLIIRFRNDLINIEKVLEYCFSTLKVVDVKIEQVHIEDVVKNILSEEEHAKKN